VKYEVNECCDCATESYPCIGNSCPMRHVTYYRCDRCGCDGLTEDEIHEVDGEDLCDSCYDEEFSDNEDDSPCYECRGYGDDYSFDDNGELVDNCTDCPWNETRCDSWED
jgi:hypothetical protein